MQAAPVTDDIGGPWSGRGAGQIDIKGHQLGLTRGDGTVVAANVDRAPCHDWAERAEGTTEEPAAPGGAGLRCVCTPLQTRPN